MSKTALGQQFLSAALPVLPPLSAQGPEALCFILAGTTPHPSTPDSASPVFSLSTNFELILTVLYHDCLVAYIKLKADTAHTSLICGLVFSDEHCAYALLGEVI